MIIGISGATCSGKTTLVKGLVEEFGDQASVVHFDDYFIGSDTQKVEDIEDFETPGFYNFEGFINDLKLLKSGQDIEIRSNLLESVQNGQTSTKIVSRPFIFVEGWLVLYSQKIREVLDLKLFIDIPETEMSRRRFARSNGSLHWDSHSYIEEKIIPGIRKYVSPQKDHSDVVLNGKLPPDALLKHALKSINNTKQS